jgi:hypothetical protein
MKLCVAKYTTLSRGPIRAVMSTGLCDGDRKGKQFEQVSEREYIDYERVGSVISFAYYKIRRQCSPFQEVNVVRREVESWEI